MSVSRSITNFICLFHFALIQCQFYWMWFGFVTRSYTYWADCNRYVCINNNLCRARSLTWYLLQIVRFWLFVMKYLPEYMCWNQYTRTNIRTYERRVRLGPQSSTFYMTFGNKIVLLLLDCCLRFFFLLLLLWILIVVYCEYWTIF